jgi:hypothetical protein
MAIGAHAGVANILRPPPHALKRTINIGASKTTRKRIFMEMGKLFIFNKVACIISIFFPAIQFALCVAGRSRSDALLFFYFFLDDDQFTHTTSGRLRPTVSLMTTVFSLVKRHARRFAEKRKNGVALFCENTFSCAREAAADSAS